MRQLTGAIIFILTGIGVYYVTFSYEIFERQDAAIITIGYFVLVLTTIATALLFSDIWRHILKLWEKYG